MSNNFDSIENDPQTGNFNKQVGYSDRERPPGKLLRNTLEGASNKIPVTT